VQILLENNFPEKLYLRKAHFPKLLKDKKIYSLGNTEFFTKPQKIRVAIVGTRKPSFRAQKIINDLLNYLSPEKYHIVSGGALGVDALAHSLALKKGFSTEAWLVGDPFRPTPRRNASLFQQILKCPKSCFLTPESVYVEKNKNLQKYFWLQRNAWLVASADFLVIVEARQKSGTLASLSYANDFGVPVFAFRAHASSGLNQETNSMISRDCAIALDIC